MTGSIQQKKGYFYTVIYVPDGQGGRKQKWEATGLKVNGNKRRAEEILRRRLVEYDDYKDTLISKDIPFWQFMEQWLDIVRPQIEPNTHYTYSITVNNQIVPYFKNLGVSLKDLQAPHIQAYYAYRMSKGVTANTVKHDHASIHKALNYAVKTRIIPYNPASLVDLPKKKKYVAKFYNDEQTRQLVECAMGTILETVILFTISYGLRRSEVAGLRWDAIDFHNKTVTIQHTVTGSGKELIRADRTKNLASFRTLPLLPSLEEHLHKVKAYQTEMKRQFGHEYIDEGYICTWEDGSLIRPDYISLRFRQLLEENSLERIRFHDLRHSAASTLLANGFSLKEVSEFLGHCDIGTTANIYGHLQYQSKVNMANRMDELLLK